VRPWRWRGRRGLIAFSRRGGERVLLLSQFRGQLRDLGRRVVQLGQRAFQIGLRLRARGLFRFQLCLRVVQRGLLLFWMVTASASA
jgi:hypothetical protein